MVLGKVHPLSIASQRQRTTDADHREVVRDRWRFDPDIRPSENLLLNGRRRDAVKPERSLVKQRGTESVSVGERQVPQPSIVQNGEARGRSSELRDRE